MGAGSGPPPEQEVHIDLPTDETTSVAALQRRVLAFCQERDWARYHSPRNLAMALSVEVGELLELYLWSADDGPQPPVASRRPKVEAELADVAICLLNLSARAGVDLSAAVAAKLAANAEKYPVELARGRMLKSTELGQIAADPAAGLGGQPARAATLEEGGTGDSSDV
jgi:NTP pyrophosphatase (non-canonical NTP hydrolase)